MVKHGGQRTPRKRCAACVLPAGKGNEMSDALKFLGQIKARQREFHKERVKKVMSEEVPQHILATKELADDLVLGDEGYARTEAGFFFKEKLVNRLMHLAYLHGRDEIGERSFNLGREKAIAIMQAKLEEL